MCSHLSGERCASVSSGDGSRRSRASRRPRAPGRPCSSARWQPPRDGARWPDAVGLMRVRGNQSAQKGSPSSSVQMLVRRRRVRHCRDWSTAESPALTTARFIRGAAATLRAKAAARGLSLEEWFQMIASQEVPSPGARQAKKSRLWPARPIRPGSFEEAIDKIAETCFAGSPRMVRDHSQSG
jgi:hypothetical protein